MSLEIMNLRKYCIKIEIKTEIEDFVETYFSFVKMKIKFRPSYKGITYKKVKLYNKCEKCGKDFSYIIRKPDDYPKNKCRDCTITETCLKRYGKRRKPHSKETKAKISKSVSSKECQSKTKQTCLEKYGVESTNKKFLFLLDIKSIEKYKEILMTI